MQRRLLPIWIICILFSFPVVLPAQTGGLQTNAKGGSYNKDQRLWFSAPVTDRLVVSLDGNEIFKGIGSASVLLSVPSGTEKHYTIHVQRRSAPPDDTLLEEQSFFVHIDKKLPQKPDLSVSTVDGLFCSVNIGCEQGAVLEGVYFLSGAITHIERTEDRSSFSQSNLQAPFYLVVWAVDAAGNCSEPLSFTAEAANVSILNPVPGFWQNMQTLVIQKQGSGDIYWTDDEADPFSSSAKLYEKPIMIEKTGKIKLRIGIRLPNGLSYEKSLTYEVSPVAIDSKDDPITVPDRISSPSTLHFDDDFQWSIAPGPWLDRSIPIQLVPVQEYQRFVYLLLKNSRGIYRYPILLDGTAQAPGETDALVLTEDPHKSEGLETNEETLQKQGLISEPELVSAGALRVLHWKNTDMGIIRYHIDSEPFWKDYYGPFLLPQGRVTLEWILDKGLVQEGPNKRIFVQQDLQPVTQSLKGFIVYRSLYPQAGTFHTLDVYEGGPIPTFTACTGEDVEWKVFSAEGEELFVQRTDVLPPPKPSLSAPAEGSWVSGPITIDSSVPSGEESIKTIITATLQYPSGVVELLRGEKFLDITVPKESPVVVSLTAFAVDASGNQGPSVSRTFTIDANSVYVSEKGSPDGDGSRNRPVNTLEKALEIAKELGRSSIQIQDRITIEKPLVLDSVCTIEGPSTEKKGDIVLRNQGQILIHSGAVQLGRISISSEFQHSPAIEVHGGTLEMTDTSLFMKGSVLRAIVCINGEVHLNKVSINLEARESATALWGEECLIELQNTEMRVRAGQYANGVEQRRGHFSQNGGAVYVTARDGSLWQFFQLQQATVQEVTAVLASNFVAQACVSEGFLPQFTNSVLYFKGSAPESSVFTFSKTSIEMTGLGGSQDARGILRGNYFIGFKSLLNNWDHTIDIKTFNRIFAVSDTPNFIDEVP